MRGQQTSESTEEASGVSIATYDTVAVMLSKDNDDNDDNDVFFFFHQESAKARNKQQNTNTMGHASALSKVLCVLVYDTHIQDAR